VQALFVVAGIQRLRSDYDSRRAGSVSGSPRRVLRFVGGEKVTEQQRTAIANHCRLAEETANPKFRRLFANGLSLIVTVNSGYE